MCDKLLATETSIIIVISEFNQPIIENLLLGALKAYAHNVGKESDISVYRVPCAFEIPGTIRQIMKFDNPHAIVALGAVIRGETPHFEFISSATTNAIMELSISYKKPISNGIITCLNMNQAIVRSKTKGQEAAKAVLSVINL